MSDGNKTGAGLPLPVLLAGAALLALAMAAGYLAMQGGAGGPTSEENYDLSSLRAVPPDQFLFKEERSFGTGFKNATCLALAPDGTCLVAGDGAVKAWDAAGNPARTMPLAFTPSALAVGADGTLYAGAGTRVLALDPSGKDLRAFDLAPSSSVANLQSGPDRLFVADGVGKVVQVLSLPEGTVATLARTSADDDGLVIYSPGFDLALGADGLLRVVDPGRHRLKLYDPSGTLISSWPSAPGMDLPRFCGCCNPKEMALLPDGSVVTGEKGIPRVKVYDPHGRYLGVVAGPDSFPGSDQAPDVAADRDGRVFVLDRRNARVLVFARRQADRIPATTERGG